MPRGKIAFLGLLLLFFACFAVALLNSSSVIRQSISVPYRIPQVAAGVTVDLEVETGAHSILGLAHCDQGPLRFQPTDGSGIWEFRCAPRDPWGDRIEFKPNAPGRDGPQQRELIRVEGRLVAPASARPGRLRGRLAGQLLAPIHLQGLQFENRVLEIETAFDVQVVETEAFRASLKLRAALFWSATVLGIASLIAFVVVDVRRERLTQAPR